MNLKRVHRFNAGAKLNTQVCKMLTIDKYDLLLDSIYVIFGIGGKL